MAELSPLNLDAVLADLKVVVGSAMMLGGQLVDFADPFGNLSEDERKRLESRGQNKGLLAIAPDVARGYEPDGYMQSLCDDAWHKMQTSLQRLSVMLEDGDVELLDCQPVVTEQLKGIWSLLEALRGEKPAFVPGKPDPLWKFVAERGVGMRLESDLVNLQVVLQSQSGKGSGKTRDDQKDFVATPLQQKILEALDGQALKKDALAAEVCAGEGTRLYRKGGIKELMKVGLVANQRGWGYYRPDAPPDGLIIKRVN